MDLELVPEKHSTLRDSLRTGHADNFQTPAYALEPLIPYLKAAGIRHIWEPACGRGNLVEGLCAAGFSVVASDLLSGTDFLTVPPFTCDALVSNPPFSCKDAFIARCYELGKPFALLMPLTALEGKKRQALYRQHGVEVILMDRRINFETPSGKQGGAWFATCWITHGINIGQGLTFSEFSKGATLESAGE